MKQVLTMRRSPILAPWLRLWPPRGGFRVAAWIAGTAAVCAFYEHLPQHPDIRRDLTRWLAREEFTDLREAFCCHLPEQDFADFEAEFLGTTKSAGK